MVNTRAQGSNRIDGLETSVTRTNGVRNNNLPPRRPRGTFTFARDQGDGPSTQQVPTAAEMFEQMKLMQEQLRVTHELLRKQGEEREVSSYSRRTPANDEASHSRSLVNSHHHEYSHSSTRQESSYGGSAYRAPTPPRRTRVCSYDTFLKCKPTEFKGEYDAIKSTHWLREMEVVFDSCDCDEGRKVTYATRMLKGGALDWWDTTKDSLRPAIVNALTWNMFKSKFQEEYCSKRDKKRLEQQFLDLKVGDKSIHEYASLFMEKLRFVGHMVKDEEDKIDRYVHGLPPKYRGLCRKSKTLAEAIQESKLLDDDRRCEEEHEKKLGLKRKSEGQSGSNKKFKSSDNRNKGSGSSGKWCSRCKAKHFGDCNTSTPRCHKCGKTGHMIKDCTDVTRCFHCKETTHLIADCPKKKAEEKKNDKSKIKSRAFKMTAEEAKEDDDVVSKE